MFNNDRDGIFFVQNVTERRHYRFRTAQGKPGKRDFFEKKSGKTWKTQGIF